MRFRHRLRWSVVLLAVAALVFALAGCVKSDDSTHPQYDDPKSDPGFSLPDNPRVVALGWSDGAIALELGVKPVAIYDWLGFGPATKGVGPWDVAKFGADSPTLISAQSQGAFNYQQIEELKPDLILNVRAANNQAATDRLRQIAPLVTAPAGSDDFAVNWKTQTQLIGKALGKGADADKLIASTEGTSSKIKADNPGFAGKKFVYGVMFASAYGAYLQGDARFDVFADLGFVQNPPILTLQSSGFFANVPSERVGDLNADVALLSTIGKPFSDLQNNSALNSLAVVRDGRAIELPENDPTVQALSAGTPVSLQYALEQVAPKLKAAAAK